ncbi:type I secretion system permease/ATPase [Psychromarinibacter sp. C21-152]|uniref:Type I secretion system permease/ATPase n=1 Tax=Psychromarinibacter sediminicola TaxID=3033385 RepID=A0AAE3NN62_9RHOB|nr:type I secretion system permease/ATPase [Psychromarinibacter sediminicola]MDF0599346.1 type I secretion system permease/ATPase [Psychromarinibacter sediminicola]
MRQRERVQGLAELRAARAENRSLFVFVGVFSFFVNLLMLTGPLFMLQVYDRVLGSRSEATLLALVIVMAFLFAMMGLLDYVRGRVLARIGARFQNRLDHRVFAAMIRKAALVHGHAPAANALRDLEAVQRLLASPVFAALFDIPWTPVFLLGIALFHPWLGALAVVGGGILVAITVLNQIRTAQPVQQSNAATLQAEQVAEQIRTEAELIRALGMQEAAFSRWNAARSRALTDGLLSSDRSGGFSVLSKTFRLFLQSAMLGLGAYLVLTAGLTPGAMIAASILLGRALAPLDLAIGQWPSIQRAMKGWRTLAELLAEVPEDTPRTPLPVPKANLTAEQLTVIPPGEQQASLRLVSFQLQAGQAMGVIGPSGSGKSTLARAITGVWRPAGGKIRLDGAALDNYDPDVLGCYIGYLPQRVQLFDGTIAENISRLSQTPDAEQIVAAAKKAAAHEMILKLPDGYDTRVTAGGGRLSGGQIQRIGLARAMYGEPVILVLDEPNSNLDNEGSVALNKAIRAIKDDNRSVIIMAHRPAAIEECETLLVLDGGARRAYGPRDAVMKEVLQNYQQVRQSAGPGGTV